MDNTDLLHLLDTTCAYYTRRNRGIKQNTDNTCVYYEPATGHKCAIGRLLTDEEAAFVESLRCDSTITRVMHMLQTRQNNILAAKIWSKLSKYPVRYLQDIQHLHDELEFWDDEGLTTSGRKYAARIIQQIINQIYE
jgi:hypothetical protein